MTDWERWLPDSARVSPESFSRRRRPRLGGRASKGRGPTSLRTPAEAELRRGCPGNLRAELRATGFLALFFLEFGLEGTTSFWRRFRQGERRKDFYPDPTKSHSWRE